METVVRGPWPGDSQIALGDLGPGTWDLGPETWDLGPGTWTIQW